MKKKDGGESSRRMKKRSVREQNKMEGLWRELKQKFECPSEDTGGNSVSFEVESRKVQRKMDLAVKCHLQGTCIGRSLCAGPDFCSIYARLEEGALAEV